MARKTLAVVAGGVGYAGTCSAVYVALRGLRDRSVMVAPSTGERIGFVVVSAMWPAFVVGLGLPIAVQTVWNRLHQEA